MSRIVNEGIQLSYLNVHTSIIDKTAFEKDDMLTYTAVFDAND
ncbi:MAG: hypothetical protein SPJ12_06815 [Duodenibacillus sp.]|nr:hypothetical protein [Duodenibacillus sp.]